ncbi:peptidoglycan DD-metalloendopeptidase family protein [Chitinibacter sp. SCUT-21]|uniref:peptidoglycan DD-metalloendopeptidase family protein n=1 Tax=Chitinibacter sp. SCUT-21 TaxID=2970891 RepID=UPI0035A73B8B
MRAYHYPLLMLAILLSACSSSRTTPAPIIDGHAIASPQPAATPPAASATPIDVYTVKKGDTLYRIATEFKVSPQNLMAWNQLVDSNIKIGQSLRVAAPLGVNGVTITPLKDENGPTASSTTNEIRTITSPKASKQVYSEGFKTVSTAKVASEVAIKQQANASYTTASSVKPVTPIATATTSPNPNKAGAVVASSPTTKNTSAVEFGMPTAGKITRKFSEESKGVDITGKHGQSIVASAQGKVVYAGAGLRGYGKMVILQHSNGYLTAYAHNDKLLVKEGDVVKKGEKIAEMGKTDADHVKLHFEVRKGGKPVDPEKFIATE